MSQEVQIGCDKCHRPLSVVNNGSNNITSLLCPDCWEKKDLEMKYDDFELVKCHDCKKSLFFMCLCKNCAKTAIEKGLMKRHD